MVDGNDKLMEKDPNIRRCVVRFREVITMYAMAERDQTALQG